MSEAKETVFIVDDDPSVLKALRRLLAAAGFEVAAFESPQAFLDRYDPGIPGCLVLDVAMPGLSGMELQQELAARGSALPVVFLTGHGDVPLSVQAMKRGAADFLTKPVDENDLLAAVRGAFERGRALHKARAETAEIERRLATLTPREREVLQHIVAGRRNKQVAGELGIVEKTIKVHRARVMEKMRARSLAELVRLAERAGVRGDPPED
jgi:FixJ family two-component response regulator